MLEEQKDLFRLHQATLNYVAEHSIPKNGTPGKIPPYRILATVIGLGNISIYHQYREIEVMQ